jgi:hypothetical protein
MKRLATGALGAGGRGLAGAEATGGGAGGSWAGAAAASGGLSVVGATAAGGARPAMKGVPHASQRNEPGGPSTSQVGQTTPRLLARRRDMRRPENVHQCPQVQAFIEGLIS